MIVADGLRFDSNSVQLRSERQPSDPLGSVVLDAATKDVDELLAHAITATSRRRRRRRGTAAPAEEIILVRSLLLKRR